MSESVDLDVGQKLRDLLKEWQCDACKVGDYSKCNHTKEDAKAFIQNRETGEIKYFCCIGCLLLQLETNELKRIVEDTFNRDGDYRMINAACEYAKLNKS